MDRIRSTRVAAIAAVCIVALTVAACGDDDAPTRADLPNDQEAENRAATADPASPPPSTPQAGTRATTSVGPVEQAGAPVTLRLNGKGIATLLPVDEGHTRVSIQLAQKGGGVRGAGVFSGTCASGKNARTAEILPLANVRNGRSDTEARLGLGELTSGTHVLVISTTPRDDGRPYVCVPIRSSS